MTYFTREEARAFDRWAIEELGIPSLVLMENAGRGAAQVLWDLGARGRVVILCGKGNNGGDGLVLARHLAGWGARPEVLLLADPATLSPDAAVHWLITRRLGLPTTVRPDATNLAEHLHHADWLVDALFGTGLTGPVRSPYAEAIETMNASAIPILALDIPSGLDADTGLPLGPTVRAHTTVTFVAAKAGFRNPAAAPWLGQLHIADIGVTPRLHPPTSLDADNESLPG